MLGLPFTEDHALSEKLRSKRPRQECFNCLSFSHRVQECPAKIDEERINIHRKIYTSQAQQAQEQEQLLSNRYTSDLDSRIYKGFMPGKISDQLREALGINENQLPPFIYIMRKYGYPKGWLIEAQVKKSNLAMDNGDEKEHDKRKIDKEEGALSEGAHLLILCYILTYQIKLF